MTNNPTIDGVSRELIKDMHEHPDCPVEFIDHLRRLLDAPDICPTCDSRGRCPDCKPEPEPTTLREHCKQCAEVVKTWPEWKQNCLGGAPAVEVQRVINRLESSDPDFNDCTDAVKVIRVLSAELKGLEINSQVRQIQSNQLHEIISGPGDHHAAARRVYDAGYRKAAALQSTIAQLQARIAELESDQFEGWSIDTTAGRPILVFEGCSVIEDVRAYQIIRMLKASAELESGRSDVIHQVRTHGSDVWEDISGESLEMCQCQPEEYEIRRLYTAPPAPVTVIRNAQRYEYLRERDLETIKHGGVFAGLTPDNLVLNGEDLDSAIDACLDAAAALNGPAK